MSVRRTDHLPFESPELDEGCRFGVPVDGGLRKRSRLGVVPSGPRVK